MLYDPPVLVGHYSVWHAQVPSFAMASAVAAAPLALGPFFPLFLPFPPTKWGLLFLPLLHATRLSGAGSTCWVPGAAIEEL